MKDLHLPAPIEALVNAQNDLDTVTFANQFADDAIVYDEGKSHSGKTAIQVWNEAANEKYCVTLKPEEFSGNERNGILTVQVSGNFSGSPISLRYHFTLDDSKIKTLSIT